MEKKNADRDPLFYKNKEEMEKPLDELMEELRNDIHRVRGKLWDIKQVYGWDDRIVHLEGGLTCMLVAMHDTGMEWKKYEEKFKIANALASLKQ